MALILDESFVAGIPGGFATARAQAGTLVVAHNAGAQAVDLSNASASHNIWDITSIALSAAGEVELDVEFVSDQSGVAAYRLASLCALSGEAGLTNGYHLNHTYSTWNFYAYTPVTPFGAGARAEGISAQNSSEVFNTAGDRQTLTVRWDMSVGPDVFPVEGYINGVLKFVGVQRYTSLRPGVATYQSTIRVHGLKAWDAPQVALTTPLTGRATSATSKASLVTPTWAGHSDFNKRVPPLVSRADVYVQGQAGNGRIQGTVKEKGTPDMPLSRVVILIDERTGLPHAKTWSDGSTGAYEFQYVRMDRKYTIVSYDHTGTYRAVIADNQTPQPMP
jgi:hypothetical protein